jgi:hypothetical protein
MKKVKAYLILSDCDWTLKREQEVDPDLIDEVVFGLFDSPDKGKPGGDISVEWRRGVYSPQLVADFNSWKLLVEKIPDVLANLSAMSGVEVTPLEFCAMLERCGYKKDAMVFTE